MQTEDERCAEARRFQRLDDAFKAGDVEALRAAVDDPGSIPNGQMPVIFGTYLVYAIYHSPIAFIRTLLELGAEPNAPVDDGFPPLIAALMTGREDPGSRRRDDVDEVMRLLLRFGADPNQRGINDYTALHMAAALDNPLAVLRLLDAGADPDLRTRIDDAETPLELARTAGLTTVATLLEHRGKPPTRRLRSGLTQLVDIPGTGELVRRQHAYRVRVRTWLNRGEPVRWTIPSGPVGSATLTDEGETLLTTMRVDRSDQISGVFYGMDGMRIGGTRRLEIAPHLAYGERGVPGIIPPHALLIVEVSVLGDPSRA